MYKIQKNLRSFKVNSTSSILSNLTNNFKLPGFLQQENIRIIVSRSVCHFFYMYNYIFWLWTKLVLTFLSVHKIYFPSPLRISPTQAIQVESPVKLLQNFFQFIWKSILQLFNVEIFYSLLCENILMLQKYLYLLFRR